MSSANNKRIRGHLAKLIGGDYPYPKTGRPKYIKLKDNMIYVRGSNDVTSISKKIMGSDNVCNLYWFYGENPEEEIPEEFPEKSTLIKRENNEWVVINEEGKKEKIVKFGDDEGLMMYLKSNKHKISKDSAIKYIRRELGLNTAKDTLNKLIDNGVKQIILTGAPGTGKTYTAKKFAEEQIEGVYINREKISDISKLDEEQKKELNKLKKKCKKFVQFHSSYDYTDFVEGLRPAMIQKGGEKEPAFVKLDGTFKKFCRKAAEDEDNKYFFIIDEINRVDLSRVFGELMYGLEESYRGKEHYFSTQYQNLPTYEIDEKTGVAVELKNDVFKEGFYIPENVYIIGTMNDIDRSVETFDFALRRRFYWYEVQVEDEIDEAFKEMFGEGKYTDIINNIKEMNNYIAGDGGKKFGLNKSYQIGHAYFKDYDGTDEKVEDIFKYRIEPLLREYCRGRDAKDTKKFIDECRKKLTGKSLEGSTNNN